MSNGYLMSLDAGGGGVRCLLVDVDSGSLTFASRPVRQPVEPGTEGWGYNLDTKGVWAAAGQTVREVLARARIQAGQVLSIAATGMRFGLVLVDRGGEVVWAVPNRDARAASQGMDLASRRGREFNERTGHWPSPIATAARLLWLKETSPELFARTHAVLAINEWLTLKLCDRLAAEPSQAGESSLFDLAGATWAQDLIGSLKLPQAIFPDVKKAGTRVGALSADAAKALGLKVGTPVAVGGADTQCALLGMGVVDAGRVAVVGGTTVPVQLVVDAPLVDHEARLWAGCHVVPKRWVLESNAGAAGEVLDWLGDLLFPGDPAGASRLVAEAAFSEPGAGGFLSSLGAQIFHASQLGLPVETLSFSHLSAPSSNQRHLARAVLEGLAFSVRANLDQLLTVGKAAASPIALGGGLSRSRLWAQILANVTGRPVEVAGTPQASLLGAAVCAGAAVGAWPDLVAGAKRLAKTGSLEEPSAELEGRYRGLYEDWQRWRTARTEADALAAEVAMRSAASGGGTARSAGPDAGGFRPKILVTTPFDEASLDRLRALGPVEYCTYIERQRVLTGDDLVETLQGVHVLVTEVDIVDAASVERLPDLRVVVSCRSNPVNVDVAACTAFGVPVLNTPGRNAVAVAEMTVALLLALVRRIPGADAFLRQPGAEAGDMARMGIAHESFRGTELSGKTIGIVGFGRIGRTVAAMLRAFGARIVVHDPVLAAEAIQRHGAEPMGLDDLLAQSDIVSLHAAVTDDSRGLLGAAELARMKKGSLLVNSARAALVDEAALAEALKSGHLGGAALDVFRQEPPASDHPLLRLPNVVGTPHIAGNTAEVAAHQGDSVATALEQLLRGELPDTLLNPTTLPAFRWTGERRTPSATEREALAQGSGPAISDLEAEEDAEAGPAPEAPRAPDPVSPATATAASPASRASPAAPGAAKKGFFERLFGGGRSEAHAAPAAQAPAPVAAAPSASPVPAGAGSARVQAARAKMEAILRDFLVRVDADPSIRGFAKGKAVTALYLIPDIDLSFHMAFEGDVPRSAMGRPAGKAQVSMKMNAEVLDAVFMERIGGMKAAMSGQLAFAGNTMKAMSLQRIQKDLCRLYAEARAAIGDPGDLTGLAAATAEAAAPATAAAPGATGQPQVVVAAPAVIRRTGDERDELVAAVEELFAAKLLTSTGGNVSVRRASKPDEIWITPSALPKGALSPELMVRINLEGEPLDEDAGAPSSERLMHARIMARRPDVNAVIHSHGTQTFLLGVTGLPFLPICTESAFLGDPARIPFLMPGSDELAESVIRLMGTARSALLLNHGALVAATSLRRGVDMTRVMERTAEVILTCAMLGKQPPPIPAEVAAQLLSLANSVG